MTVTCLAFSGVIAEDGLDTFGAHHGTASRPSFSRWTRVTFAFNAASSTNDATSTTRTVDLTGWMSPAAGDAIIVWAGRGTANTLSFTPSGGGGGAGGACVGMPIVRVEEGVSR